MKVGALVLVLLLVVGTLGVLPLVPGARASPTPPKSTPLHGNVTGPSVVATSSSATFYFNESGGPAYSGGHQVGTVRWTASLSGANKTGSSVAPTNGTITGTTSQPISLTVKTGKYAETLTLAVVVTSTLAKNNTSVTLSQSFRVVVPYTVQATLVAGPDVEVLPFKVSVALDGTTLGVVTVPSIAANSTYAFSYRYASAGLSGGYHTFTLTILDDHGLVTFSNGRTVQTTTFYVAPATPSYTAYYVLGVVAFFGVLFIYATRVAARRRGAARR